MRYLKIVGNLAMLAGIACAHADSLYQPGSYQSLTSDLRPRRAGDLITVMVYENASATSTANTSAGRDAGVGLDIQRPGRGYAAGIHANNQMDDRPCHRLASGDYSGVAPAGTGVDNTR